MPSTMAPIKGDRFSTNNNEKDVEKVQGDQTRRNKEKEGTTVQQLEHGETLPGWTVMRPLKMGRMKGKNAPFAQEREVGVSGGDGRDSKVSSTNGTGSTTNGGGEIEVLSDVRSLDGLLGHESQSGIPNTHHNRNAEESEGTINDGQKYRVYKRRWFGLVQLMLLNIVVSWDWLSFSANSTTASTYYRVSPTAINWLSTGFLFAFVVVSPVTLLTLHRGGPKASIITASALLLVGNWIRYGATRSASFVGVMIGQILIGFAQPFVLAAPTRYSDLWFSNRGRVAATAAMSLANPLGGAVAQLVGPELASEPKDIPFMVLVISIVATVACVPSFFLAAKPPTPPSASASTPKQDILPSLRHLSKLPEFYMLAVPFAFYVGLFNSLSSLINQFLQPYSFTETQAGIAGALLIVVGLVAAAITSPILDKTKSYLMAVKVLVVLTAITYLVFTFAPASRNEIAPYLILAVLGATSFSVMPIVLEYVIELTHPISPEVTSTICWTGGQILGGMFIIISGELRAPGKSDGTQDDGTSRPPGNMYNALIFQTVMAVIAMPAPLFLGLFGRKEGVRMRRIEADKEAASRRDSEGS